MVRGEKLISVVHVIVVPPSFEEKKKKDDKEGKKERNVSSESKLGLFATNVGVEGFPEDLPCSHQSTGISFQSANIFFFLPSPGLFFGPFLKGRAKGKGREREKGREKKREKRKERGVWEKKKRKPTTRHSILQEP